MAKTKVSLGVFSFERETRNTKRFSREDEDGRIETQYVQKEILERLGDPSAIEVTISVADGGDEE
jgi:hypothetical protein